MPDIFEQEAFVQRMVFGNNQLYGPNWRQLVNNIKKRRHRKEVKNDAENSYPAELNIVDIALGKGADIE